jgi:hypothetical protein
MVLREQTGIRNPCPLLTRDLSSFQKVKNSLDADTPTLGIPTSLRQIIES